MKGAIAAVLILLSLTCIVWGVIEVAANRTALWSGASLSHYLFHFVTMFVALALLARKPKPQSANEGDA